MPTFEIPDGPTTISLKSQIVKGQNVRAGSAAFGVNNKSGQQVRARVSARPEGDSKSEWFEILGEPERDLKGNETQKFTVNIKLPATVPIGDHKFRFRAVNVNDPDNDYTDSPVATFSVAAVPKPQPGKFPWWAVIVGGVVLLLIVVGVILWLVLSPSTPTQVAVPNVVGQTYAAAQTAITNAGLVAAQTDDTTPGKTPGTVVSETPAAGGNADTGSTVTLAVAKGTTVPDVTGKLLLAAQQELTDSGFTAASATVSKVSGAAPGTVIATSPTPGSTAAAGATITLTVDPGIAVPNEVGNTLGNVATNLAVNFAVSVSVNRDGGPTDVIMSQQPTSGVVAKGSSLDLTVHGPKCSPIVFGHMTRCPPIARTPYTRYLAQKKLLP